MIWALADAFMQELHAIWRVLVHRADGVTENSSNGQCLLISSEREIFVQIQLSTFININGTTAFKPMDVRFRQMAPCQEPMLEVSRHWKFR